MNFKIVDLDTLAFGSVKWTAFMLMEETRRLQRVEADSVWQHPSMPLSLAFQTCVDVAKQTKAMDRADMVVAYIHALSAFAIDNYPKADRAGVVAMIANSIGSTIKDCA